MFSAGAGFARKRWPKAPCCCADSLARMKRNWLPPCATIVAAAPFRQMFTPGGHQMSVAMTNCGSAGWVTDRTGYRYSPDDPETGKPWPAMPPLFHELADRAAEHAGFAGFAPDVCLINRYVPGARMSLHQDKDELDFAHRSSRCRWVCPRSSCSAGLKRSDKPRRFRLEHGDIAVWGGPSRLFFHGVAPLADGDHPIMGPQRLNLTFRKVR